MSFLTPQAELDYRDAQRKREVTYYVGNPSKNLRGHSLQVGVHAKLKHGHLWRLLSENGWTVLHLANLIGCGYHNLTEIVALKRCPSVSWIEKHGRPLAELCGVSVDEMWPEWSRDILNAGIRVEASAFVSMSPAQLSAACSFPSLPAMQESVVEDRMRRDGLDVVLRSLPPREEKILRMRFYDNKTYAECAQLFNISITRAADIEHEALKRLRGKSFCGPMSKLLRQMMDAIPA